MDPTDTSSWGSAFSSLLGGFGAGLGNAIAGGRTPTAQQYLNPTTQLVGVAGQPGTTPTVATPVNVGAVLQQAMPWLLLGGAVIGAIVLVKAVRK